MNELEKLTKKEFEDYVRSLLPVSIIDNKFLMPMTSIMTIPTFIHRYIYKYSEVLDIVPRIILMFEMNNKNEGKVFAAPKDDLDIRINLLSIKRKKDRIFYCKFY